MCYNILREKVKAGMSESMSEKDIRFDNIVKTLYPPVLYFMITLFVEVGVDFYLFFKQAKSVTQSGGSFLSSYRFMDNLQNNLDEYTYLITFLSALIGLVVFGILYIRECSLDEKKNIKKGLKFGNGTDFLMVTGLAIFGSTGLGRFVSLLPLDNIIGNYEATSSSLLKGGLLLQILSLVIVVPITEALIYRGLVFRRLQKLMDVKMAMIVVSVIFGVFHFNLLQGVYSFLLSLLLVCVFLKYQSIFVCMLVHSVANAISVLSNYYGISEIFNRSLFVYFLIMIIELAIALLLFLKIMNAEMSPENKNENQN